MTHIVSGVSAYDRKRWKVTLDEGAVTFLLYRGEMNQAGIRIPRELPGNGITLINGHGQQMFLPALRRTAEPDPYTTPHSMTGEPDSCTPLHSMTVEPDSCTPPHSMTGEPDSRTPLHSMTVEPGSYASLHSMVPESVSYKALRSAAEPAGHDASDRKPVDSVPYTGPAGTVRDTAVSYTQENPVQEITEEQWQRIREEILLPRAKKRALFYLKNGDRSEFQIRSKLKEGFYPPEIIEEVMAFLKKYRLADDARFTENYVNQLKATKSRREIEAKLYAKGLKGDAVKESLAGIPGEDEYGAAEKALAKRHTGDRRKDYAYLARRGFSGDAITHAFQALRELYASLPEEDDF